MQTRFLTNETRNVYIIYLAVKFAGCFYVLSRANPEVFDWLTRKPGSLKAHSWCLKHHKLSGSEIVLWSLCFALSNMATQNHNPSATIMSSKNGRVNEGAPVDGHSVTKRLRHELMTLMVSRCPRYLSLYRLVDLPSPSLDIRRPIRVGLSRR